MAPRSGAGASANVSWSRSSARASIAAPMSAFSMTSKGPPSSVATIFASGICIAARRAIASASSSVEWIVPKRYEGGSEALSTRQKRASALTRSSARRWRASASPAIWLRSFPWQVGGGSAKAGAAAKARPTSPAQRQPDRGTMALQLAQRDFLDPMAAALGQLEVGAWPGRQNVLVQIDEIDAHPDRARRRLRFVVVEIGVLPEIAAGIAEGRVAQAHEPLDVPLLEQRILGVQEDREVEEIGNERNLLAVARQSVRRQDVDALDDQYVRTIDGGRLALNNVVSEVRVDRRSDLGLARLDRRQEPDERAAVVAFRESLAVHDALTDQLGVGVQKAVGGHELDLGGVRPARHQGLKHARRRGLSDCDGSGDPNDVRHFSVAGPEKPLRRLEQTLRRGDVEREQAREGQIDRDDLVERDRVVVRLQLAEVVDRQGELRVGAQLRPFVAREPTKRGLDFRAIDQLIHVDPLGFPLRGQPLRAAFSS